MLSQNQKHIYKRLRQIILFICGITLIYFYQRFAVLYINKSSFPLGIFSKSYVLIDKQFYHGRKLRSKDRVMYLSQNNTYIGYIVATEGAQISHKKNTLYVNDKKSSFPKFSLSNFNLSSQQYLVYGSSYEIIHIKKIKARLLMVLTNESF